MRARPTLVLSAVAALGFTASVTSGATELGAQENPRFGVWQMQSDAPPPQKNIMTYEPWGDGGMRITVASTNRQAASTSSPRMNRVAGPEIASSSSRW